MKNEKFLVDQEIILIDFLRLNIKNKSKNNLKSNLKRGNVLVDGKVITKHDYFLKKGQTVIVKWLQINDKKENIDIIYEDELIIVINKPAGLLSISTATERTKTAYYLVSEYLKNKNPNNKVFIVHRLDRETSGVILFAKNEKMKNILQNNWDKLVIKRGYIALVEGKVTKDGEVKSWLAENKKMIVYSTKNKNEGKYAITNYKVIKSNKEYSLLEVDIKTGRKNQIRVHMKDIGHSVAGDAKYGSNKNPLKRLGLHANILKIKNPLTSKIMEFEASIPNEFLSLFK